MTKGTCLFHGIMVVMNGTFHVIAFGGIQGIPLCLAHYDLQDILYLY